MLDYLNRLRDHWAAAQIDNEVIVLSEADARELSLAARLRRSIEFGGRPCSLLVHYSGYGYDRRGVCRWLLREIERARQELGDSLRVVTMIHELYAFGPPWRSAFWLGGAQAWVAAGIARASDALWTNTECHARWLRARVDSSIAIETHPVFSTVGEPHQIAPAGGGRIGWWCSVRNPRGRGHSRGCRVTSIGCAWRASARSSKPAPVKPIGGTPTAWPIASSAASTRRPCARCSNRRLTV